ncbi:MAG: RNA polymerase sigma-70 factor [Flavobacteriaceae bacterium]|nr:RNA polymerase sigma-70 factor [Flavobacteriaceae bacterium]
MKREIKKEFILLLKSGDESAFTELINKYNRRLFAYAVSLSGDYSLAKDIVQDVFLKTYEFRKRLNPEFSIEGFLYRSVYNQFINVYHKNKSLLKVHDEYVRFLNQIIDEPKDSEFDKLIKIVNESINNLPKRCKEIFVLSKKEGYTNLEISEILNISIKTVEAQITIAFKSIRLQVLKA